MDKKEEFVPVLGLDRHKTWELREQCSLCPSEEVVAEASAYIDGAAGDCGLAIVSLCLDCFVRVKNADDCLDSFGFVLQEPLERKHGCNAKSAR